MLLNDGFIEPVNPLVSFVVRISHKGVGFITKGGYTTLDEENRRRRETEDINRELVRSSISMNKLSKYGIAISIIVSLVSLLISILAIVNTK